MYFNENKEDTNIDKEFNNKNKGDSFDLKKILLIVGCVILFIIILLIIISIVKNNKKYFVVLEGDETMTIYQGATYNEPGYSGFDNKKHDLTSEVNVKSNLDAQSIGTYTIIYTLNNKSISRTINVIEKPKVTAIIHLLGDKNMTIKMGEKFEDPGYRATNALTGDITDKVAQTGMVDTSKKGVYRIVYSVVDSDGATVSEVRTVTVE